MAAIQSPATQRHGVHFEVTWGLFGSFGADGDLAPQQTSGARGGPAVIRRFHQEYGLAIFLVEHDMKVVMAICRRIQVLDRGRILASGTPVEIRGDRRVVEAYLGKPNGVKTC